MKTFNHDDQLKREAQYTDSQLRAYKMLQMAGERIGMNNYKSQLRAHIKAGKSKTTFKFFVTDEHQLICDSMSKVLAGEISDEDVYHIINSYEVEKQRLLK